MPFEPRQDPRRDDEAPAGPCLLLRWRRAAEVDKGEQLLAVRAPVGKIDVVCVIQAGLCAPAAAIRTLPVNTGDCLAYSDKRFLAGRQSPPGALASRVFALARYMQLPGVRGGRWCQVSCGGSKCCATSWPDGCCRQGIRPQQGAGNSCVSVAMLASSSGMAPPALLATQPTNDSPS